MTAKNMAALCLFLFGAYNVSNWTALHAIQSSIIWKAVAVVYLFVIGMLSPVLGVVLLVYFMVTSSRQLFAYSEGFTPNASAIKQMMPETVTVPAPQSGKKREESQTEGFNTIDRERFLQTGKSSNAIHVQRTESNAFPSEPVSQGLPFSAV